MSYQVYREFWGADQFWARAMAVRDQTRMREGDQLADGLDGFNYSEEAVRQAVVHTREDMVMVVSLLADANRQLRMIAWLAVLVAVLLLALVLR